MYFDNSSSEIQLDCDEPKKQRTTSTTGVYTYLHVVEAHGNGTVHKKRIFLDEITLVCSLQLSKETRITV